MFSTSKIFACFVFLISSIVHLYSYFGYKIIRADTAYWLAKIVSTGSFHHDFPTNRKILYIFQVLPWAYMKFVNDYIPIIVTKLYMLNFTIVSLGVLLYFLKKLVKYNSAFYYYCVLLYVLAFVVTDSYSASVANISLVVLCLIYEILFVENKFNRFRYLFLLLLSIFCYEINLLALGLILIKILLERNKTQYFYFKFSSILISIAVFAYNIFVMKSIDNNLDNSLFNSIYEMIMHFNVTLIFIVVTLISPVILSCLKNKALKISIETILLILFSSYILNKFSYNYYLETYQINISYHLRVYLITFAALGLFISQFEVSKDYIKVQIYYLLFFFGIISIKSSLLYGRGIYKFKKIVTDASPCLVITKEHKKSYGENNWNVLAKSIILNDSLEVNRFITYSEDPQKECLFSAHEREIIKIPRKPITTNLRGKIVEYVTESN